MVVVFGSESAAMRLPNSIPAIIWQYAVFSIAGLIDSQANRGCFGATIAAPLAWPDNPGALCF